MKPGRYSLSMILAISMSCFLAAAPQGATAQSAAPVPRLVNFTGKAADAQGKPIPGIAGVTFAIYKDQYEGAPLWLEPQNIQADAKGNYTAQLGATKPDGLPLDLFSSGDARWLGVTVNGGQEQPRVLLLSVPYALKAADAETLGGKPLSAFQLANPQSNSGRTQKTQPTTEQPNEISCAGKAACKTNFIPQFSTNGGSAKVSNSIISQGGTNIAIAGSENVTGDINSGGNLSASGNVTANGNVGASTMTAGASGNVIVATMSGNTAQTAAVTGTATATGIGNTYGVAGYTSTGNGVGVFGQSNAGGTGLYGLSAGGDGVFGTGSSAGIRGTSSSGTGIVGKSDTGTGVEGDTSGSGTGVVGNNNSYGAGVAGNSYDGDGVDGVSSNSGYGVYGSSFNASGVQGAGVPAGTFIGNNVSSFGITGSGVFALGGNGDSGTKGGDGIDAFVGTGDPNFALYAGYFQGDVHVAGNLYKSGGSFKIDHPLDPATKYLSHSFVESPDMMNIYNGNATLDGNGEAAIELPYWFETLNRDFRYQLTPIGAPVVLYVAEEVAGNKFKIAGGRPGGKVSWQVTGIRQDVWANANRIPVEEEKSVLERGYYIHPELYGAPAEKQIEWARHPEMMKRLKEAQARPRLSKARSSGQ